MSIKYKHQNDEYKLKQSEDDKYSTLKFSKCDDKYLYGNLVHTN